MYEWIPYQRTEEIPLLKNKNKFMILYGIITVCVWKQIIFIKGRLHTPLVYFIMWSQQRYMFRPSLGHHQAYILQYWENYITQCSQNHNCQVENYKITNLKSQNKTVLKEVKNS
jgi:hypothetical protein